jgi:hypothetical protein
MRWVKLTYSSVRPQIPTSNEQSAFHSSLAKIQATETIKSNASAFIFARRGPPNCRGIDPHCEVESAMNAKGLATAKPLAPGG